MKPRHNPRVLDHRARHRARGHDGDLEGNSKPSSEARTAAGEKGRGRSADKPSDIPKAGWKDILWRTKEQMKEDNLSIVSAGVAFYIFLGLIPALGAVISIWGLVADPATIQQQVDSMGAFLPPQVIQILDEQMSRIASQEAGATFAAIFGLLLALWSGAKAMKAVMMALNIAYEEEESRGFFKLNAAALGLTLASVLGFLLAVGLIVAAPLVLEKIGIGSTAAALVKIFRWPVLAVFAVLGLGVIYRYGPDRDPARWRWVTWGATIATLAWLAVSAGFSFYVANFADYNKTYGSLGAVVVLLLWFLISAYVALLGAELNAEMEHQTERDTTGEPEEPRGQRQAYVADHVGPAKPDSKK
jgi:membrane protein